MYYQHVRKAMARALAATRTLAEARVLLSRQASSRQRLVWLALANGVLVAAAIGAYNVLPNPPRRAAGNIRVMAPVPVGLAASVSAASVPAASTAPTASTAPGALVPAASVPAASLPGASVPAASVPPTLVLAAAVQAASAVMPTPATPSVPVSAPLAPENNAAVPATHAGASKPRNPALAATTTAPSTERRYYINVGLFAEEGNARRAHGKLQAAGLAVFTQSLNTNNGKRTRVRVGPFDTREDADAAAGKIQALALDAVVYQQ